MKKLIKNELFIIILGAIFFVFSIAAESLNCSILAIILYIITLIVCGFKVFLDAIKGILRLDLLDEKFLMSIASVGAMIIGEYTEGVAVMLFFLIGEYFEHKAVRRSRASIKSLMDINPDEATVVRDGEEIRIDADDVVVGDTLIVRPGERVAVDCVIISGESDVDTSSMTGESTPVAVYRDSILQSGFVVINGTLFCKALRPIEESAAMRVLSLVEEATERKSREESFITVFSRYYTPIVVILAVLMATVLPIFNILKFQDALYRALIFLVISCPCALVISVPMSFFGGIGAAASKGILFKGGNVFSNIAMADAIAFDKTGTLTDGNLSVVDVITIDCDKDEVLRLAASAEYGSNHPVAKAISSFCDVSIPERITEIAGKGVVAVLSGDEIAVGNIALMKHLNISITKELDGVYVAKNGNHIGNILLSDTVKSEASVAVSELSRIGVKNSYILSGDRKEKVEDVAKSVGIENYTSEMLPEDKFLLLENIIENSKATIFVGDGINDSPSLARADVGIAMGNLGADAAIEAADVVIMSDNLKRIPEAICIARKTLRIAKQNIFFAIPNDTANTTRPTASSRATIGKRRLVRGPFALY